MSQGVNNNNNVEAPAPNVGRPAPDPMAQIADILGRLTLMQQQNQAQATAPAATTPAVRAISCKTFTIGEDWANYAVYFRENVRAAYNYAHGEARLNEAC